MTLATLASRSLRHYWRTNLAVALGVGVAVSALAGALVVGDSVRGSLRDLALTRLGRTDHVITASGLFTAALADRLPQASAFAPDWADAVPLLALDGAVVHEASGRRAERVQVFGVDDRFWRFHGLAGVAGPAGREALLSADLARELGLSSGDSLILRAQKPTAIPAGVIQGRRDEPGRALRLTAARVLTRAEGGEFSPRPQQGPSRTLFVPLGALQQNIERPGLANMVLVSRAASTTAGRPDTSSAPAARDDRAGSGALRTLVGRQASLADLGLRVRAVEGPALAVESEAGYLADDLAEAALGAGRDLGLQPAPAVAYLATTIRAGGREVPYSLVAGLPQAALDAASPVLPGAPGGQTPTPPPTPPPPPLPPAGDGTSPPLWLSQWTADDLQARAGDTVDLDYFLWSDTDGLSHGSARFVLAGVLPMRGVAVDQTLAPDYPGVSTTTRMEDWDPPFPVDLSRVRPQDEAFWRTYRTAPKAFIRVEDGRRLWQSPYGSLTSVRLPLEGREVADARQALEAALRARLASPAGGLVTGGFQALPVRDDALAAAAGTTDFGEYFTYFSFVVVVASLLLTVLFFRLGVEQRAAEVGLLGALGYSPRTVAGLFLREGAALAVAGAAVGSAGAVGYSALMMFALRTLWVDAVGTTELFVHVSALPLGAGAGGGLLAAVVCIWLSLRALWRAPARHLMSGGWLDAAPAGNVPRLRVAALAALVLAAALVAAAAVGALPAVAGYFGSGTLLLVSGLCGLALWLRGTSRRPFTAGRYPLLRFGIRNARYRPARSVLSTALVAAATFLVVSVGAFRQGTGDLTARASGSGGYALVAESVSPLMHDPATASGREALGLGPDTAGLQVARFRLRPGDDTSCLNLYQPRQPRLLGATRAFLGEGRFAFAASEAVTEDERRNPWLLLDRPRDDGAIPVIGDATSLAYALHLAVGDEFVMGGPDGAPIRLRIVGALRDSVLQSELVMSETPFTRLFPRNEGYRVFLLSAPAGAVDAVATALEQALRDFGFDAQSADERLAAYHRVENTYLSTFQALGGLGLVLGTLGLGAVLLRSVIERRRELALLRATGYTRGHLVVIVLAESLFLLACGLALGTVCAVVAIGPAFAARGDGLPIGPTLALLAGVLASGLLSTVLATRAIATTDLLGALKHE